MNIDSVIINTAFISWTIGLVLLFFSNATGLVPKTKFARTGWRKYLQGYSIKEIKQAIMLTEDESLRQQLKKKIIMRRATYLFMSILIIVILAVKII